MSSPKFPSSLILPTSITLVYFAIHFSFLFILTAPSDPLQYVLPALHPENGFPFFDRILLWMWIRAFTILPIPPEYIGGIATLTLSALTLGLSFWWLQKRINTFAASVFAFLYILSPWITSGATYTYPTRLLTFILVLSIIIIDIIPTRFKHYAAGFFFPFALLSKIQGYSFSFLLAFGLVFNKANRQKWVINSLKIIVGFLIGALFIFLIISVSDGIEMWNKLYSDYFLKPVASAQFKGRNLGGVPHFYKLLRNIFFLLSIFGALVTTFKSKYRQAHLFGTAAFAQGLGLLAIYIITQRGGPVISNYWLDSHILGLISFAAAIGIMLESSFFAKSKYFSPGLVSTAFLIILIYIFVDQKTLSRASSFSVLVIFFFASLWIYKRKCHFQWKWKWKWKSITVTIAILLYSFSLIRSAHSGVKGAKRSINLWGVYHETAKYIRDFPEGGTIWVSTQLNNYFKNGDTSRIQRVYEAFYDNYSSGKNLIWSDTKPETFDYLFTNRPELINQYKNISQQLGKISIIKIKN